MEGKAAWSGSYACVVMTVECVVSGLRCVVLLLLFLVVVVVVMTHFARLGREFCDRVEAMDVCMVRAASGLLTYVVFTSNGLAMPKMVVIFAATFFLFIFQWCAERDNATLRRHCADRAIEETSLERGLGPQNFTR